jgi:hypothetical protein
MGGWRGLQGAMVLERRVVDVHHDCPPSLPQVVQTVIHLDALKPCAELRASLKAPQSEEGLREDLLRQVFGVGRRSRDDAAIGHDKPLVPVDKRVEWARVRVSRRPGQFHKLVVGFFVEAAQAPLYGHHQGCEVTSPTQSQRRAGWRLYRPPGM